MRVIVEQGLVEFTCPGCGNMHILPIRGHSDQAKYAHTQASWEFNGNAERPTLQPSILAKGGHYCEGYKQGDKCWCTYNIEHHERPSRMSCFVCHSYVTDGRIQFLADCSHSLAGQTVDLPCIGNNPDA